VREAVEKQVVRVMKALLLGSAGPKPDTSIAAAFGSVAAAFLRNRCGWVLFDGVATFVQWCCLAGRVTASGGARIFTAGSKRVCMHQPYLLLLPSGIVVAGFVCNMCGCTRLPVGHMTELLRCALLLPAWQVSASGNGLLCK
jgi:hypothetical protein